MNFNIKKISPQYRKIFDESGSKTYLLGICLLLLSLCQSCRSGIMPQTTSNGQKPSYNSSEDEFDESIKPIFNKNMDTAPKPVSAETLPSKNKSDKSDKRVLTQPNRKVIPIYRETIDEEISRIQAEKLDFVKKSFPFAEIRQEDSVSIRLSFDAESFFFNNSDDLLFLTKDRLLKIYEISTLYPASTILVESIAETTFPLSLIEQRAIKVTQALANLGLDYARMATSTYQDDELKVYDSGALTRRRIDFLIRFDKSRYER